tara:strand:+ start:406 stop:1380 length:975 start_codon:yes stop_codon:yes gene_type:complete
MLSLILTRLISILSTLKTENILEVSNLTKYYGSSYTIGNKVIGKCNIGVDNISFNIKKGEIFGFLGPNGSGKTTTMRSILNYLKIQNGHINIFGVDHRVNALSIRKNIGYLPGDLGLYDNFSGDELLRYSNSLRNSNKDFLNDLKSIFSVDLTKKIRGLSKGNKQQIGILLSLASKPDFLILDEPTSGLDPLIASNFTDLLRSLKKEGITIFLSSHDLNEVQDICDRVAIIKNGKLILVESVNTLQRKSTQNVNVTFSRSSSINIDEIKNMKSVISVEQNRNNSFVIKIKGDSNGLINFLSKHRFQNLTIEDPSLEDIFLQYYQ